MFLLIFKDILQIAFCQELLFQIMIALRLLTIVFLFSFRAKISWNVLSGTRPNPKRWMKSISIRKRPRWSKPLIRPISWSMMKFWPQRRHNNFKEKSCQSVRIFLSWMAAFFFCLHNLCQVSSLHSYLLQFNFLMQRQQRWIAYRKYAVFMLHYFLTLR